MNLYSLYMADDFFSRHFHLRAASFDLGPKSVFLNFDPKARPQTPLIAEDGISFLDKWYRKRVALPLSVFIQAGSRLSEAERAAVLADFEFAVREMEKATGEQNIFLSVGFLRSQGTAPLLFVPVHIDGKSLTVSLKNEPPVENVPLRLKTRDELDLPISKIFWDGKAFQTAKYFQAVERAVDAVAGWKSTSKGLFLGFYNAASLYAHRDFESEIWKENLSKGAGAELLSEDGFHVTDSDLDEQNPDEIFDPTEHYFVRTLDSEATTALLESLSAQSGIDIIETPPGSEAEDFAANIAAENVSCQKKILVTYRKPVSRIRLEKILFRQSSIYKDTTLEKSRKELKKIRTELANYNRAVNIPVGPKGATLVESLIGLSEISQKKVWDDEVFKGAENLGREDFHTARGILEDLLERQTIKDIQKAIEAFDGISIGTLDAAKKEKLEAEIHSANEKFQTLATLASSVSGDFSFDGKIDIEALSKLSQAITPEFNSRTPSFDGWNLESKDWDTYEETLRELPVAGKAWSEFRRNGSEKFLPEAIDAPLGAAREILKSNQNRKLKVFSEYYHDAKKTLLKTLKNPKAVKTDAELLNLSDELSLLQECKKLYMNASVMARHLLGQDWQFEHTDWDVLGEKIRWFYDFRKAISKGEHANLSLAILSKYGALRAHIPDAEALRELCQKARSEFEALCAELEFCPSEAPESVEEQAEVLKRWINSLELFPGFVQINSKRIELQKFGLLNLEKAIFGDSPNKNLLVSDFTRFWNSVQIQTACKIFPAVFSLSPKAHSKNAKLFREATDDLLEMNLKYFRSELEKAPENLCILSLEETANLPQNVLFENAVILDADAVTPLEAMPAILRSRHVTLLGDSNMPEPNFPRIFGAPEKPEFFGPQFENILAFSLYRGAKRYRLPLNARHRHPVLIDFSNRHFYGGKIQKFPPPNESATHAIQVTKSVKNLASVIASETIRHAERHPMQSLGILTFTESRKQEILAGIEAELSAHPDLRRFLFAGDPLRDLYVKRPEEAVGEYRDTIFICAEPIATVAGEEITPRHVNVCATLALSNLQIFGEEIPGKVSSANPGVNAYLEFLHFASESSSAKIFGSNPILSPLEEEIDGEIHTGSFQAEKNWGYGDFTVPFAVRDENNPEHFLVGIDTDENTCFLTRSVEDRMYIRPKLFKQLGWKIIKLYAPTWFRSKADERNHILTTIAVEQSVAPPPVEKSEEKGPVELHAEPYRIVHPPRTPESETPIPEMSKDELVSQLKFYVDSESPIHEKSLLRRLLHFHGLHRAGPAVVRTLKEAITQGITEKAFIKTGTFFYSTQAKPAVLRDRSALPEEERLLVYVSPEERALFPPDADEQTIRETLGVC